MQMNSFISVVLFLKSLNCHLFHSGPSKFHRFFLHAQMAWFCCKQKCLYYFSNQVILIEMLTLLGLGYLEFTFTLREGNGILAFGDMFTQCLSNQKSLQLLCFNNCKLQQVPFWPIFFSGTSFKKRKVKKLSMSYTLMENRSIALNRKASIVNRYSSIV